MIILRLQGLPWSATAKDIRLHFEGLSIPDGGVHIIGGEEGDVFIAFTNDEDARKAMQRQKVPLMGSRIILMLSSKAEMQEVIAESRAAVQSQKLDPFGTATVEPSLQLAPQTTQRTSSSREGSVGSMQGQSFQRYPQVDEQRSGTAHFQAGDYQSGTPVLPSQAYPSQEYDTKYPPSQYSQGYDVEQPRDQMPRNNQYQDFPSTGLGGTRGEGDRMSYGQSNQDNQFGNQEGLSSSLKRQEMAETRQPAIRDYEHHQDRYGSASQFGRLDQPKTLSHEGNNRFAPKSFDDSQNLWSSSQDRSFPKPEGNSRTLLSAPKVTSASDEEQESISMSYPPAGPGEKFGMPEGEDEDQRSSMYPQDDMFQDHHLPESQGMTDYGGNGQYSASMRKDSVIGRGTLSQTQFGDAFWVAESAQSQSSRSNKSFPREGQEFQRREEDTYAQRFGDRKRIDQPSRGYQEKMSYESESTGLGSYEARMQSRESSDIYGRSAGYPPSHEQVSLDKPYDFDSRKGLVPAPDSLTTGNRSSLLDPDNTSYRSPNMDIPKHEQKTPLFGTNPPLMEQVQTIPEMAVEEKTSPQFYAVRLTGLPYDSVERDVSQFLQGVDISPGGIQIHHDPRGNPVGTANVRLAGPRDLDEALQRHHQYMGKRFIAVRPCLESEWEKEKDLVKRDQSLQRGRSRSPIRGSKSPLRSSNTSVEVKNIPTLMRNTDIYNFFEGLRIKTNGVFFEQSRDCQSSGNAYVEFVDSDTAQKACQKSGRYLGRKIVSIRLISKEIMEANKKQKSGGRSPSRRSPDRRRGSSPYSRKGRSPGRRGRSSPSRSSSRSSPGRNGPGRRGTSPSRRDGRDRSDRDSSRSGKRNHSPSRHSSQDRKDALTEKRERKEVESKTPSRTADAREHRTVRSQEKDQSRKADESKQNPMRPLLSTPETSKVNRGPSKLPSEEKSEGGLLKTPDLPADKPSAVGEGQVYGVHSRPLLGKPHEMDARGRNVSQEGISPDRRNQNEVTEPPPFGGNGDRPQFGMEQMNWQQEDNWKNQRDGPERQFPGRMEGERSARDGRMGPGLREPWDNRRENTGERELGRLGPDNRFEERYDTRSDRDRHGRPRLNRWGEPLDEGRGRSIEFGEERARDDHRGEPMGARREGAMPKRGLLDNPPSDRSLDDGREDRPMQRTHGPSQWQQGPVRSMNEPFGHLQGAPSHDGPRRHEESGRGGPMDRFDGNRRGLLERPVEEPNDHPGHFMEERDYDPRSRGLLKPAEDDRMPHRMPGLRDRDRSPPGRISHRPRDGFGWQNRPPPEERSGPQQDSDSRIRSRVPPPRGEMQSSGRSMGGTRNSRERDRPDRHDKMPSEIQDFPGRSGSRDRQFRSDKTPEHWPGDRPREEQEMNPQEPMELQNDGNRPVRGEGEGVYNCAHVRNIPYGSRWPEIAQFFGGLQIVPGGIHIMVGPDGKPNGHCFVEFTDPHQAVLTERRRMQRLRDRPLQINACSKAMMLKALAQSGEMPQGRHPDQSMPPQGPRQPFGPRGIRPGFQGNPRMPFPGPSHHGPGIFGPGPRGPGPRGPGHRVPGPRGLEFGPHGQNFGPRGPEVGPHGPEASPHGPNVGPHGPNVGPHGQRSGPSEPLLKAPMHQESQEPKRGKDEPPPKHPARSSQPGSSNKGPDQSTKTDTKPKEAQPKPEEIKKEPVPEVKKTPTPAPAPALAPAPSTVGVSPHSHKGCVVSASNLPLTITVAAIMDFFKGFKTVKDAVKLDTHESTGKATGQAKIVFVSSAEANRAIKERNNRPLNGRIVRLHVV